MNYLDQLEFSETLEKLAKDAEVMAMTAEELIYEIKYMAKVHKDLADKMESQIATELSRLYEDSH